MQININATAILRKLDNAVKEGVGKQAVILRAKNQAALAAIGISKSLIAALESHPVTRELDSGAQANSGFLPRGNLASYFGLPMELVHASLASFRKLMDEPISVSAKHLAGQARYEISVKYPPLRDYYEVSPAPEYGGSWLKKMEEGTLQNFGQFIAGFGFSTSRTGGGIQNPNSIKKARAFTVPAIPYISDIYHDLFSRGGLGNKILTSTVGRLR